MVKFVGVGGGGSILNGKQAGKEIRIIQIIEMRIVIAAQARK